MPATSDTPTMYDFSRDHIIESAEATLKRLGIEYLDVLPFHRPDPLVEPEEVAAAMNEVHNAGKVRAFGVSNHSALQIELLQAAADLSLVANQMAERMVQFREVRGAILRMDVVSTSILRIAGRAAAQDAAELVEQLAAEYGVSREAIVVAWVMRHPAPIQPVIGTTNPARIRNCVQADSIHLSRVHRHKFREAAPRNAYAVVDLVDEPGITYSFCRGLTK